MRKLIDWSKRWIIPGGLLFLTAFIPLYPKLPILNVNQTWTYIRLEDFVVAVLAGILAVVLLAERRMAKTPLTAPIIAYLAVGFVSLVNALLFIFPHFGGILFPQVAVFHFLRRIEYFSAFFIAYEAFRNRNLLKPLTWILPVTVFLVALYGFGQKFLGFPAFLTMNEEFAKGVPLRLPSNARFPSTFGGHYDVAAYLVLTIPIIASMIFAVRRWYLKVLLFIVAVAGLIMLLFTASRISFGVYLVAMTAMLWWRHKRLFIVPVIILSVLIMNFTSGASERFAKTFRMTDVVVDLSTGKPIGTIDKIEGQQVTLKESESPAKETLPTGSEFINVPGPSASGGDKKVETVTQFGSKSLATGSGEMATISGSFLIQKALVYDISITTRFQGQWPKAIAAFKRNILLGSGYSALSVAADGDYHRMLGETGVLGFVAHLGIFVYAIYLFVTRYRKLGRLEQGFVVGVFGGFAGLLVNAVLIDVFEASKVAFSFYLLLGSAMAILAREKADDIPYGRFMRRLLTNPVSLLAYAIGFIWYLWWPTLSLYFTGDDFTWLKWAAQSSIRDIPGYFANAGGFFYRPIPKLWYLGLFTVFWMKPFAYHAASLVLLSLTMVVMSAYLKRRGTPVWIRILSVVLFGSMAVHQENVFWVSGHSSMLSGLFALLSLYVLSLIPATKGVRRIAAWAGIGVSVMAAMMCYDGTVTMPVVLSLVGITVLGMDYRTAALVALSGAYWLIRSSSGAVPPSGDYGYKLTTLPVNLAGNSAAYIASMFGGPAVLDWASSVRMSLKGNAAVMAAAAGALALGAGALWKFRRTLADIREPAVYLASAVIVGAAYAGLGGVADRYAYIPSVFVVLAVASAVTAVLRNGRYVAVGVVTAASVAAIAVNSRQITPIAHDWEKAGDIVQRSLLAIKSETFPPKNVKTFVFVNMPIRYGRAWVYPTGMNDAIWHMFRESPFTVTLAPDIPTAFKVPMNGDLEVFIFENYELKRGTREVRELNIIPATNK